MNGIFRAGRMCASGLLFVLAARATSVPSLTFEELTDRSEIVFSGQVTRTWSDWDAEHKFIWTHHELAVSATLKGNEQSTVVVSEPGGVVGNRGLNVAGAVVYSTGDSVVVFAERMPNGYLRTTGWGQGKYRVESGGRLHADSSLAGIERVNAGSVASGTPLRSLEGMSLTDLKARIGERMRSVPVHSSPAQGRN
jgi:hypothetical protein